MEEKYRYSSSSTEGQYLTQSRSNETKYQSLSSSEAETLSVVLTPTDVLNSLKISDIITVFWRYIWFLILGTIIGACGFFLLNVDPPLYDATMTLRVRSVRAGENRIVEKVALKEEAEELRSPELIEQTLASLNRYVLVTPNDSLIERIQFFIRKYKNRHKLAISRSDKYWVELKKFTVERSTDMYSLITLGNRDYTILDSAGKEILVGRLGELVQGNGIQIQIDAMNAPVDQRYHLNYLTHEYFTGWASRGLKTKTNGKDGLGGTIEVSLSSYDKSFLIDFLRDLGERHVERTDQRLRENLLVTMEEKKNKKEYLEEDLFKLEQELKKLQKDSVRSGNTAFTASDLQKQTNLVNRKLNLLLSKKEKLNERYQDVRTIFSGSHPIVVNANTDLKRVKEQIVEIQTSTSNTPALLLDIYDLEDKIRTRKKEVQLLEGDIAKLEDIYKMSKNYISVSQEPKIITDNYVLQVRSLTILGALCGFVSSMILVLIYNTRIVRTTDFSSSDFSTYTDGKSDSYRSEDRSFLDDRSSELPSSQSRDSDLTTGTLSDFLFSEEGSMGISQRSIEQESVNRDSLFVLKEEDQDSDATQDSMNEDSQDSRFSIRSQESFEVDSVPDYSISLPNGSQESDSQEIFDQHGIQALRQEHPAQDIKLLSTGVWSAREFGKRISKELRDKRFVFIGIINSTDLNLSAVMSTLCKEYARKRSCVLLDADIRRSSVSSSFNLKERQGLWDLLAGRIRLRNTLLRTSLGFYIIPNGEYTEQSFDSKNFRRVIHSVEDKFRRVLIHYPSDTILWKNMRQQLEKPDIVFWLQADYSLYSISSPIEDFSLEERTSEEEKAPLEDLISLDSMSQDSVLFQAELLARSIWSGEEFAERFSSVLHNHNGHIGIVNASDIPLSAILTPLRSIGAKNHTVLFIDAQQSKSVFDQSFASNKKRGFWDVMYKKNQLKNVLLQAAPGFYIMPQGKYVEKPNHLQVFQRLVFALKAKFDQLVIHYPDTDSLWQSMVTQSGVPQVLLVLREDYRLYRVVIPVNHSFSMQKIYADLEREA